MGKVIRKKLQSGFSVSDDFFKDKFRKIKKRKICRRT